MRYCSRCVMPDTRPYIGFDEDGVCYPCRAAEKAKKTDWKQRWLELEQLADRYRGLHGSGYDCIIAASGGKDSYYQTYIMKEKLGMNPLLVSVNNFSWTKTGQYNWENLCERFNVDSMVVTQKRGTQRSMFKQALEKIGAPTWFFDKAIYCVPVQVSLDKNIPLVIYGEDTNYLYGGPNNVETPDARKQFTNDVVKPVDWSDWDIDMRDAQTAVTPKDYMWSEPTFLSYYLPWNGYKNMEFARTCGFKTLDDTEEWHRAGFLEQYDQIDSVGYLTHTWFKFPKFGHQRVSEVASLYIRDGRMTRKEAVKHVLDEDWKLDKHMLSDFLSYIQYDEKDFWKVVDRFANTDIVEKRDGVWRLRPNVEETLIHAERD